MKLSWRRFTTLLRGLPNDAMLIITMMAERKGDEEMSWRKALAEATGREWVPPTSRITLDEYVKGVG